MTPSLERAPWSSLLSGRPLKVLASLNGPFRRLGLRLALGELNASSGSLRQAMQKLPQASNHVEQQFLAYQNTLEHLSAASSDLIVHGQNVVTMASGQEMGEISFEGVFALLESPLDYLAATHIEMEELAGGLRASVAAISRLLVIERALEATVAPLQITQVMFRIQSAYLPSEHRQIFNSVTDEIVTLQGQIQSAFSEHVRVLTGLHHNLLEVVETLEQQMATQGRKVKEKRSALSSYLGTLTTEIKDNAERDVEFTAASQELGEKVSQAVMTLQTQDIVSQKLEHASGGIAEVVGLLNECDAKAGSDCFARVSALTRVETAQLDGVIAELQDSDKALHRVLSGINGLIEKLSDDTLLLKEFSEMTASASGSIQGLLESLEEIREMVAATLATTKMAEDSVLPVRTATEGLTNTVQTIAHEMHLIALNAQIQAIQMGEGTGLDVLAAHSTEVSQATTRISMEVASKVAEVATSVADHSDRLSALRKAGERQQSELNEKGQLQEAALHRFRDQTLTEFRAAGEALDKAREAGRGIGVRIDLKPAVDMIADVRATVAELQRRSETIENALHATSDVRSSFTGSLEKRYTMASERKIHSQILGAPADQELVQSIEVWPEETAQPSRDRMPEPAATFSGVAPSKAGDFGAGVDLF